MDKTTRRQVKRALRTGRIFMHIAAACIGASLVVALFLICIQADIYRMGS